MFFFYMLQYYGLQLLWPQKLYMQLQYGCGLCNGNTDYLLNYMFILKVLGELRTGNSTSLSLAVSPWRLSLPNWFTLCTATHPFMCPSDQVLVACAGIPLLSYPANPDGSSAVTWQGLQGDTKAITVFLSPLKKKMKTKDIKELNFFLQIRILQPRLQLCEAALRHCSAFS